MIQCGDCEYFHRGPDGTVAFTCDPFSTIKEVDCLVKWQLIKLDSMVRAYQATVQMYQRMAPLQEKMLRQMEREVEEVEEADSWKYQYDDEDDELDDDDNDTR
ncbi:MAG: hypothetical protein JSV19_11060 [Phycisphaerales bacterium]|nr:MAG: hypothetical protein JSV19_11060 [Phycisphaerales bacterium]